MSLFDLRWPKKKKKPTAEGTGWPPLVKPLPPPPGYFQPIRVTDDRDGELLNRGYAYWSTSHIGPDGLVTLFVGHTDGRPKFFRVNLQTGQVERLGAMLGYQGTSEGWYYLADGYVYLCDGPRLRRVDPFTGDDHVVLDISSIRDGCRLWQPHSDSTGIVHSATVEQIVSEGAYPRLGTVVSRRGEVMLFAAEGLLDESHLDASGQFLIIEENNGNRIIDLSTRDEQQLSNADGALSHVDCGQGFMVGEDDQRGACTYLDLRTVGRRVLFETWAQGVVSVKGGRCLVTDATHVKAVALDGSGVTRLAAHGMVGSGYDFTCRASLDPTGRVATWLSNGAGRMDLYLLAV